MDRFIGLFVATATLIEFNLKSNMDRFIELLGNGKLSFDFI